MTDAPKQAASAALHTALRAHLARRRADAGLPPLAHDRPSLADARLRAAHAAPGSDPFRPAGEPCALSARLSQTLAAAVSDDGALPAGVPEAAVAALRADLAAGRDPWATAADGRDPDAAVLGSPDPDAAAADGHDPCAAAAEDRETDRPGGTVDARLCMAARLARLWPRPDDAAALGTPGALTLLRCRDADSATEAAFLMPDLVPLAAPVATASGDGGPARDARDREEDEADRAVDLFLADSALFQSSGLAVVALTPDPARSGRGSGRRFGLGTGGSTGGSASAIGHALRAGRPVVVAAAAGAALPDGIGPLLTGTHDLPNLDAATVVEMLRASHSETGQVAVAALRAALPSDAALARMTDLQIDTAFLAPTSLGVARRLAAIAATAETAPQTGPRLDDLHGLGAARAPLDRLARDLRRWRDGAVAWHQVSASLVLHGPPGCGKTMAARALAGTAGAALVATSYAECQAAGHLGDFLARLEARVAEAIARAPCVFFLDEVDSFGHRGGDDRNARYMTAVVNALLEALSRLAAAEGVAVIGATNRPGAVDPALKRAGRFDRHVAIPLPDRAGRAAILRANLGGTVPAAACARAAAALAGASGADAEAVAREAAGRARDAGREVTARDLAAAVDSLCPAPPQDVLRRDAIHAAGQLIVGHALGTPVARAVRIGAEGPVIDVPPSEVITYASATVEIARLLAGRAAERLVLGTVSARAGQGPDSALARATFLALAMELQWGLGEAGLAWRPLAAPPAIPFDPPWLRAKIAGVLEEAEVRAANILTPRREGLATLAATLEETRELSGKALARHVADARQPEQAHNVVPLAPAP